MLVHGLNTKSNSLPMYHSSQEEETQKQDSVGSDVIASFRETTLNAPTAFFNALTKVEVDEALLQNVYTERVSSIMGVVENQTSLGSTLP